MKKWSKFKKIMNIVALVSTVLTIIFFIIYKFNEKDIIETLTITFLTIAFHFDIRLIIGNIVPLFKNKININSKYYKLRKIEEKIYNIIKVKKWKAKAPTYEPDEFNIEKHTIKEIIVNMCNSEIIHTINTIVSYIPLVFIIWHGSPIVFVITSICASIYDLQFVVIQRYNRPRMMKIMERKEKISVI